MIPSNFIKEWRVQAPWAYQSQIEQDLVLSRALVALYQHPVVRKFLAFRGGTALNKLFCQHSSRYSEDIDLVQIHDAPVGELIEAIRHSLDPWLGAAKWSQTSRSIRLIYRFQSEEVPSVPLRLKIEINTVEPFSVFGFEEKPYEVNSRWFIGSAIIKTYTLNELMATKFRALYQRLKGRDLYDLWLAVSHLGADTEKIVQAFNQYNKYHKINISRAEYERNLILKMQDKDFLNDAHKVLPANANWSPNEAADMVFEKLVAKLAGLPWKGEG